MRLGGRAIFPIEHRRRLRTIYACLMKNNKTPSPRGMRRQFRVQYVHCANAVYIIVKYHANLYTRTSRRLSVLRVQFFPYSRVQKYS